MNLAGADKTQVPKPAIVVGIISSGRRFVGLQPIYINPNMVTIDVIKLVALDGIELYGENMVGAITVVVFIEKPEVLA